MKKIYCVICGKYRKCKKTKISYTFEKTLAFFLLAVGMRTKMKKYFKKKNQLRY